jgi:hypothetical protein
MKGNKVLGLALVLSIGLGAFLFFGEKTSSTESLTEPSETEEVTSSETSIRSYIDLNLPIATPTDTNLNQLFEYCAEAKEKGWLDLDQQLLYGKLKVETSPAPMEGIFILRGILAVDSNHVATIETMAQMSVRSGQLDKAKKRYQKLLSLQPENEEYQARLKDICAQLGDSDCS